MYIYIYALLTQVITPAYRFLKYYMSTFSFVISTFYFFCNLLCSVVLVEMVIKSYIDSRICNRQELTNPYLRSR